MKQNGAGVPVRIPAALKKKLARIAKIEELSMGKVIAEAVEAMIAKRKEAQQ